MFYIRCLALGVLLASLTATPSAAQARALLIFGYGGRAFPILSLHEDGDDLSAGAAMGGGIGLQLSPGTALRVSANYSESNLRGPTITLDDPTITRTFFGADLMFGTPSDMGFAPYFFLGGGRLNIDPEESGTDAVGSWAGRAGMGINYVPDNSFFVLFIEAAGLAYRFNMLGFDKLQVDPALVGGLAFAVPF